MPVVGRLKQIVTSVNPDELRRIRDYCRRKGISIYALLKRALFEYLERHP